MTIIRINQNKIENINRDIVIYNYIISMINLNNNSIFDTQFEEIVQNSPDELREIIKAYFKSMSDMQKKSFLIAKDHLGTSFNIFKSNGFVNFEKQFQTK
jgi:hypothetical protein